MSNHDDRPQLMGSKAAATTHPAEPRATLASWMLLGGAQNRSQRLDTFDVDELEAWEADLDARLGKLRERRARRSRWARFFRWGRK